MKNHWRIVFKTSLTLALGIGVLGCGSEQNQHPWLKQALIQVGLAEEAPHWNEIVIDPTFLPKEKAAPVLLPLLGKVKDDTLAEHPSFIGLWLVASQPHPDATCRVPGIQSSKIPLTCAGPKARWWVENVWWPKVLAPPLNALNERWPKQMPTRSAIAAAVTEAGRAHQGSPRNLDIVLDLMECEAGFNGEKSDWNTDKTFKAHLLRNGYLAPGSLVKANITLWTPGETYTTSPTGTRTRISPLVIDRARRIWQEALQAAGAEAVRFETLNLS